MKEVVLERRIHGVSVQHYYDVVYGDTELMKRFHAEVSKDPVAIVGDWVNGVRDVSFMMPVNVPVVMKKMIGLDTIPVIETMTLTWNGSSSFTVSSVPTLDFPGSKKFMTTGLIVVSELPGGRGCQVRCTLQCTAGMPWPMQSTIEGVMATEGTESIEKFLAICEQGCRDTPPLAGSLHESVPASSSSQPLPRTRSAASTQNGHHSSLHNDENGNEDFYDAAEDIDEDFYNAIVPARRLEDTILLCLQHIERSTSQSAVSLSMLERTMSSVDVHMQAIHDAVIPSRLLESSAKPISSVDTLLQIGGALTMVASIAALVYVHKQRM